MADRVALVSGANRGIGLQVVRELADRGFVAVSGSRDGERGRAAVSPLVAAGLAVEVVTLDVTSDDSVAGAIAAIGERWGRLDVLVNNAAVHYDTGQHASTADMTVVGEALETNVVGAWRLARAAVPLIRASGGGRIVNVSSESGSLASMGASTPAYAVSKAALNALTRVLAAELRRDRILVNSVCPGWVATDMGGSGGRPIAEGAASVLWAVDLPDDGPTGGFFRDGQPVPW